MKMNVARISMNRLEYVRGSSGCPSEECVFCSGEACDLCGAGLTSDLNRPICEHDVLERHSYEKTEFWGTFWTEWEPFESPIDVPMYGMVEDHFTIEELFQ